MNKSISPGEARLLWQIMPADCKTSLATIHATGRAAESRAEILHEAEAGLRRIGPRHSYLNAAAALELAAEKWLLKNPPGISQSLLTSSPTEAK